MDGDAPTVASPPSAPIRLIPVSDSRRSLVADRDRIPWNWNIYGKRVSNAYAPAISGKWWSHSAAELGYMKPRDQSGWSHISRIMGRVGREVRK